MFELCQIKHVSMQNYPFKQSMYLYVGNCRRTAIVGISLIILTRWTFLYAVYIKYMEVARTYRQKTALINNFSIHCTCISFAFLQKVNILLGESRETIRDTYNHDEN